MNQKIPTLIGTVIIIILAFAVGYFVWLVQKNNQIETQLPSVKINSVDETANWQTYKNDKYGFEVKYPQSYIMQTVKEGVITIKSPVKKTLYDLNIQINQDPSLSNFNLDAVIQSMSKNSSIVGQQKITFAGQSAYEGVSAGMISEYALLVKNGDNLFQLSLGVANKDLLVENKAALDANQKLILSTFKFTDTKGSNCPQYMPPGPDSEWCPYGTVVTPVNPDGCYGPPECKSSSTSCQTDSDCACGKKIGADECSIGNKKYVNTASQCPDFCNGFDGKLLVKCINNICVQQNNVTSAPNQKVCPEDAKVCPNGSSVVRTGPNCEFAPCPK